MVKASDSCAVTNFVILESFNTLPCFHYTSPLSCEGYIMGICDSQQLNATNFIVEFGSKLNSLRGRAQQEGWVSWRIT
jgi:hypothetical protein